MNNQDNNNINILHHALEYALKKGCSDARLVLVTGEENELEWRDNAVDRLHHSSGCQLTISLYVDGRFSTINTNRLERNEVENFIDKGIINTRFLEPDPYRILPANELLYKGEMSNMGLYDENYNNIDINQKLALAKQISEEINDNRIITASSMVDDNKSHKYIVTSSGFEGYSARSTYAASATVSVKGEGDERPEDYCFTLANNWQELTHKGIGTEALRRSVNKIGANRINSGKYNIVIDRWCSGSIFNPIIGALNGAALHQQSSFLLNRKGEKIASSLLTIKDNPLQYGRIGATLFDAEGAALNELNVIENGVLNNYYISRYYALKMGVEPTRGSAAIIDFAQSNNNTAELIKQLNNGVYITGFNGGNCNGTTGDFSYGIEGYLVENGIITKPISEMLMTGNMLTLWNNLTQVSNDPLPYMSINTPSLLFSDVILN
ncbi:MAG: TldD/PmbA family protein [bacterium]